MDTIPLDRELLREAREAREDLIELENKAHRARVRYEHAIRHLHASGASLREIGDAFGLSHQRVHQIVDPSTVKGALRKHRAERAEMCSFCGAAGTEVQELIAGPGVFICDRCVDLASMVLAEGGERENERTKLVGLGPRRPKKARCELLREAAPPGERHGRGSAHVRGSVLEWAEVPGLDGPTRLVRGEASDPL